MEDVLVTECHSSAELQNMFEKGLTNRAVAQTCMNTDSSRSHLVFIISIYSLNKETNEQLVGKIVLCDLAGSERLKKSKSTGEREKEAIEINKSLSALGDAIEALTTRQKVIPYRNHKLTQILQDSLGGTAKTLMFVCCSPAQSNCEETLNSLRFAKRAKGVVNVPGNVKRSPSPAAGRQHSPRGPNQSPRHQPPPRNSSPRPVKTNNEVPGLQQPSPQADQGILRQNSESGSGYGASQPLPMRVAAIERTVLGEAKTGGLLPRIAALEEMILGGPPNNVEPTLEGRLKILQQTLGVFSPPSRKHLL